MLEVLCRSIVRTLETSIDSPDLVGDDENPDLRYGNDGSTDSGQGTSQICLHDPPGNERFLLQCSLEVVEVPELIFLWKDEKSYGVWKWKPDFD